MLSLELETLDQLLGGDLPLTLIRELYPNAQAFMQGTFGLLSNGDVRLLTIDEAEVPKWRWRELFVNGVVMNELENMKLKITDKGAKRIG
ncbi:MAG TPA: hypothetical protein VK738_00310 [Terriglobales bacterium]|nr:hypothetical protein [Terriglobales bacterium]